MILVDSGPLIAARMADDDRHQVCVELFESATDELLVPATVTAEVCYMLESRAGSAAEAAFLRLFTAGDLVPVDLAVYDYERMAELVERYADFPLGGTNASVIALCERLGVTRVATLDRRHFGAVQPRHVEALTLLPDMI